MLSAAQARPAAAARAAAAACPVVSVRGPRAAAAALSARQPAVRAARTQLVVAAAAPGPGSNGSTGNGSAGRSPPSRQHLADPAKIEGSSTASVAVQDRGGALSLDAYMRLPTEQYNELDPQMISSLGGSRFLLRVPRVTLFNVWVEPEVVVDVRLADGGASPGVIFESGECRLKGSDLLQRLELDKRFVLYFHTTLTWQGAAGATGTGGSGASGNGGSNGGASAVAAAGRPPAQGSISAKADVQVWSEVVGPFRAIPRGVLQGTGNAVMGAMMSALLPVFMRKLADDYARWAADASYRARRAAAASSAPAPLPAAAAAAAAAASPVTPRQ